MLLRRELLWALRISAVVAPLFALFAVLLSHRASRVHRVAPSLTQERVAQPADQERKTPPTVEPPEATPPFLLEPELEVVVAPEGPAPGVAGPSEVPKDPFDWIEWPQGEKEATEVELSFDPE